MEKRKLSIQSLLYSRESATVFVSGRDPKAGREVGKLYSGKKGRLQMSAGVCGPGEAVGRLTRSRASM